MWTYEQHLWRHDFALCGDLGFDAKKLYQSGQCALLVKTCGELAWGKFGILYVEKKLLLWGLSLSLSLPLSVFLSLYLCPYWERIWRSLMKSQRPLMTMPSITLMETLQGVQGHNPTKKHQSLTTKEDIGNMIQQYLLQPFEIHNQSCTCTSSKSTHDTYYIDTIGGNPKNGFV